MPKKKTHKASAKRMRLTKNGKVVARRPGRGHLLAAKSSGQRRRLRTRHTLSGNVARTMASLLNA